MISQAEFDAAVRAARAAILKQSEFYSNMISDEMLGAVVAPALRAMVAIRDKEEK